MVSGWHKGRYKVLNPHKYLGNPHKVIFRSSWEYDICVKFDSHPQIWWAVEPVGITYFDPVKGKNRKYYPDFLVVVKHKDGTEKKFMLEVKPNKQTTTPRKTKRKSEKTLLLEKAMLATNRAKWDAAAEWCKDRGIEFKVITEKQIYNM